MRFLDAPRRDFALMKYAVLVTLALLGVQGSFFTIICNGKEEGCRNRQDERFQPTAKGEVELLRLRIAEEAEVLGPDHEWAGKYYLGDGLGANLHLYHAPESGFVVEWHNCPGLCDRNTGIVLVNNDVLELQFRYSNEEVFEASLIPVAWQRRRYLVPAGDMIYFCNEVNAGREPRENIYGWTFLRRGDEEIPATGAPSVPARFSHLLLDASIEARLLSVDDAEVDNTRVVSAVLDAGAQHGVFIGMEMWLVEPALFCHLRVVQVERARSHVVVLGILGEPSAQPGWRFSARHPR